MAEPKFEDVESWLINNSDKEGTPDYVKMTSAYKALDPQKTAASSTAPTKGLGEDLWGRAKAAFGVEPAAPAEPSNLPDI